MSSPVEAVERALAAGGEADDVLRAVVAALADEPAVAWAAIAFEEDGSLLVGPQAGEADESRRTRVPVLYEGSEVGELWVDGTVERRELERVAELLADYVLVGWDTGGADWVP
jgi:hypothetical protein